jgi:hypothetical protein
MSRNFAEAKKGLSSNQTGIIPSLNFWTLGFTRNRRHKKCPDFWYIYPLRAFGEI